MRLSKTRKELSILFDDILDVVDSIDYAINFNSVEDLYAACGKMNEIVWAIHSILDRVIKALRSGNYDHPKHHSKVLQFTKWIDSEDLRTHIWENTAILWSTHNGPPRKYRSLLSEYTKYERNTVMPYYTSVIRELKINIPSLPEDNICEIMGFINLWHKKKDIDTIIYSEL